MKELTKQIALSLEASGYMLRRGVISSKEHKRYYEFVKGGELVLLAFEGMKDGETLPTKLSSRREVAL
ncbi:hypothetical protein [Campylobacter curvus]|uniref:hypothetical protein n=1 Tax=Campylobacter curvus TaxID=200 RepID=UPI00146FE6C6|nr:hypothetical protein [Campylobacter curvus]